jgi:hypothetical protein
LFPITLHLETRTVTGNERGRFIAYSAEVLDSPMCPKIESKLPVSNTHLQAL